MQGLIIFHIEKKEMMLSVGHENYIQRQSVAGNLKPDSSSEKKLRLQANEQRMLIDGTNGKKHSLILMKSNNVVHSSAQ